MAVNQFSIFLKDAFAVQMDCGLEIDERMMHTSGERERERMPDDFAWVSLFCSQPFMVAGVEYSRGSQEEIGQAEVHMLQGSVLWPD